MLAHEFRSCLKVFDSIYDPVEFQTLISELDSLLNFLLILSHEDSRFSSFYHIVSSYRNLFYQRYSRLLSREAIRLQTLDRFHLLLQELPS